MEQKDREPILKQAVEEDISEGMARMADEGGGVVEQNWPMGAPIARNDLIRTKNPPDEYDPGQWEE